MKKKLIKFSLLLLTYVILFGDKIPPVILS